MEIWVAYKVHPMKVICISDKEDFAREAMEQERVADGQRQAAFYVVSSTDRILFSAAAMSDISDAYEMSLLENRVRERMANECGVDSNTEEGKQLVSKMVADAYHDITHHDCDEDAAVDLAFEGHRQEWESLQERQSKWQEKS